MPLSSLSLSVVVPTLETRELTLRCLAALEQSRAPADEILVVDDGSRDGTVEAVGARHPRVTVLHTAGRTGFTAAANTGWAAARGDLVLHLNSDTEVEPEALTVMREAFAACPTLGIAGASLRHPDGRPQWSAGGEPGSAWLFAMASGAGALLGRIPGYRQLKPEAQRPGAAAWVPATAMVVRREVRERLGAFDTTYLLYAQDLAYCLAARRAGWEVRQLTDAWVRHVGGVTTGREHGTGAPGADPAALARDLRAWIDRDTPERRARRRRALRLGYGVRVVTRTLAQPWQPTANREAFAATTRGYRAAWRAMASR